MPVHVIVDGYNVIRQVPRFADRERRALEEGRRALVAALAAYRAATGHRVTVVFDGTHEGDYEERRARERGVEVVYTARGTTADDAIVRLARDVSRGAVVVVTADHAVARQAERRGAAVVVPAVFDEKMQAAGAAPASSPAREDEDEAESGEPTPRNRKRGNPRRAPKSARRAAARLRKL